MNVTPELRSRIESHYRTHAETYSAIWGQLEDVREQFDTASREGKIAMLKLSYINSVISVQTPLHVHEEAMRRIMAGDSLNTAFESVNYRHQKEKYITKCLNDPEIWETMIDQIEAGDIDAAHKTGIDRLKFVGTVKVPFTLANLGFTSKMCLDANVVRVTGIEEIPTTVVVDRYEAICSDLKAEFPTLSDELSAYELQWLIFDFQRFHRTNMSEAQKARIGADMQVTDHEGWFDAILLDTDEIQAIVNDLA